MAHFQLLLILIPCAIYQLTTAVVTASSSFLRNSPGREWKMVGYLNMTDSNQRCPDSWQMYTSPRSCGKKSYAPCDSLIIPTSGASYQKVCGRFLGYQVGTSDAFGNMIPRSIDAYYVDGVTVTYGPPGSRRHVYTYAAGLLETVGGEYDIYTCPCAGGTSPPPFVGSDYYCESGNPGPSASEQIYSSDVLWDGKQCGRNESACCNSPDLPWFCKTLPTPISEDLEVRICTDQGSPNENVAIVSFELHLQVNIYSMTIHAASVYLDKKIHQLEISWIPVEDNMTVYIVRVVGADKFASQGSIICTNSPCLYVHPVTHQSNTYNIFVTSMYPDATLGSQNNTILSPNNSVFQNVSLLHNSNYIQCSFLTNLSYYCVVCCSTDPAVPPGSSVYNISSTKSTEVIVSLQGLTSGQMYYCKAAASNTNFTHCAGPVIGDVKMFFSFVTSLSPTPISTCTCVDISLIVGISISISLLFVCSLGVFVATYIIGTVKMRSKRSIHRHPAPGLEPSVYKMIETDQKAIDVKTNSAYESSSQKGRAVTSSN